jgi:hypothetical protein
MGEKRNVYRLLVEKQEGKRLLERPEEGGWIILEWILEVGWGDVDWIGLSTIGIGGELLWIR